MTTPEPAAVVERLSLKEKAALVQGADAWRTVALPGHGVPALVMADGPNGVRKHLAEDAASMNGRGRSVPATCFPPAVTLASTWDPGLAVSVGRALGAEARTQGIDVLLGPGVNIKRVPLGGRNFEYFSEDPVLTAAMGAAWITGLQNEGVGASLKHFAVNSQETGRHWVSSEVDERTLREIYLWAFEQIVRDAEPWTVMTAYNKVNGTHCSQSAWLIDEVLRQEWGYGGVVLSDWGAVHDRVMALAAGLDLEMPYRGEHSTNEIVAAVRGGSVSVETLERSASRVLALVDRAVATRVQTSWEAGTATAAGPTDQLHADSHALAIEVAARGTVLLKNDPVGGGPLLPLASDAPGVVVIGELARAPRYQGGGSAHVTPTRLDTALDALNRALGREVPFAPGYTTVDAVRPPGDQPWLVDPEPDAALIDQARRLAQDAGTVVLFVGLPEFWEVEGRDRPHLRLPQAQLALIDAVTQASDRVVVVLANGSPVQVEPWHGGAAALVETWLGGQGGGQAISDILLGVREPTGRLAETIPRRLEDTPAYLSFPGEQGHVRHAEGIFVGYRWYDARRLPVSYPFGFGLGYTTFRFDRLQVVACDDGWRVRVTVTNTGSRRGVEVVQVYVGEADDQGGEIPQPPQRLRAFAPVEVDAGQATTVDLLVRSRDIAYWDVREHGWRIADVTHIVRVGRSSRDLPLSGQLGPARSAPRTAASTGTDGPALPVRHHPRSRTQTPAGRS